MPKALQQYRRSSTRRHIPWHPCTVCPSCTAQPTASNDCYPCTSKQQYVGIRSARASPISEPKLSCQSCRRHRLMYANPTMKLVSNMKMIKPDQKEITLTRKLRNIKYKYLYYKIQNTCVRLFILQLLPKY